MQNRDLATIGAPVDPPDVAIVPRVDRPLRTVDAERLPSGREGVVRSQVSKPGTLEAEIESSAP